MKFDDFATAKRLGHAVRAYNVIALGDRGQDEALIPRARYGHSALCRKRAKSDLSQNVLLRIWSLAVGEARRGEDDDKHLQAESESSSQMQTPRLRLAHT
jgi:hypothetical protein